MGKRKKSSRSTGPKKQEKLATTFQCLFCNHEKSVTVKIDKKINIGTLDCKICGQRFQSVTNNLSEPVDVYSEWVDACDSVAKNQGYGDISEVPAATYQGTANLTRQPQASQRQDRYEEDFVVEDEADMEGNFRNDE